MSTTHTPAPKADDIGEELKAVRLAARAERKLHGRVLPETTARMVDAMARAEAFLLTEAARAPRPSTDWMANLTHEQMRNITE